MARVPHSSDSIYKAVCFFSAGWQTSVIPVRVRDSKQDKGC